MRTSLAVLTIVATLPLASGLTGAFAAPPVTQVDETKLVTLWGNTPVQALDAENDRGRIPDSALLEHMILVLRRSDTREAALERTIAGLTDRKSPNYHHWLSAAEIGSVYGPSAHDVEAVNGWLDAGGFTVNRIYPSRMAIDFSGTAGQIRAAFHTEIHRIEAGGKTHIANVSDPRIPVTLAPIVAGIVSLHDFHGHQASHGGPGWTVANCGLGSADLIPNCYFMTAPDVATVYDLNPLFSAKTVGTGQTIAVAEDSDIYGTNDWTMFRSLFGLSGYKSGSVAQTHPGKCSDPGTNGDDFEAILDAEYASAAAPGAAIQVASCADSKTTWGLTIAVENLVNSSSPPSILSVSYIWCEAGAGAANDKAYNDAYQQAVAEGMSVFVASGDEGAAACDYGRARASNGTAVNGLATSPYDVAVGGTDFGDTYHGENAAYWSSSNSGDYGSAKSYVPEIPWNSSCASQLIAEYVTGSKTTYGSKGFCNISAGKDFITTYAGSGGPSSCAKSKSGGGCQGYAKPSWQAVYGNPADRVRDIPDISLFSAGPVWGHAYVVCFSDPAHDFNEPCSKFPNGWIYGYGTSFASPIMAGIQALVNQSTGSLQGNPNPALYQIASDEFGSSGNPSCNATKGVNVGKKCVFHDVTEGDIDVPCTPGSADCFAPSGANGVLSRSTGRYRPAFPTTGGWDFATGLGSVDAARLVNAWPR